MEIPGRFRRLPEPTHIACLLVLVVSGFSISAYAQTAEANSARFSAELTLEAAVGIALEENPGLHALAAQSDALAAVPPQVGSLPDPIVSLNTVNVPLDTFELNQEPMTQIQFGVSQSLPFPGKLKLKRDAAQYEAEAGHVRIAEMRDALRGAVRSAWWRLFYVDRALEIVDENKRVMREFIDIAETKYRVGKGLQQDVLLAQLELSRLLDRELRLTGLRSSVQSDLNERLDRRPDHLVTLSRNPPNDRLPELPAESALLESAGVNRKLLDVQRELLEAADARVKLARRELYPDFKLGASYGLRQGVDPSTGSDRSDMLSVMFSINVPIYYQSKQTKAIEQRSSERANRQFVLDEALRAIEAQIGRGLADYRAAREQVLLLDTAIIPQARQTVASMLAGYQVNSVDFLNVLNGQLMLYNAQIDYWKALSDAKGALAGLAAAVGVETLYE